LEATLEGRADLAAMHPCRQIRRKKDRKGVAPTTFPKTGHSGPRPKTVPEKGAAAGNKGERASVLNFSGIRRSGTRVALSTSAAALMLSLALAPAAFAQDKMSKDEGMKKETMSRDSMKKDGGMKTDDGMKKDDRMKKNWVLPVRVAQVRP
jgi:pentapeptide MXKDX repeat protein